MNNIETYHVGKFAYKSDIFALIIADFQMSWDPRIIVQMSSDRLQNDRTDLYFKLLYFIFVNSGRPADFFTILDKLLRVVIWWLWNHMDEKIIQTP